MPDWAQAWQQAGNQRRLESLELDNTAREKAVVNARYTFSDDAGQAVARLTSVLQLQSARENYILPTNSRKRRACRLFRVLE